MVESTRKASMLGPPSVPKHVNFMYFFFNDILVSRTLTLPVNIFTWKKEKPCSPGAQKISVAPGEHGFFFFQVKIFTVAPGEHGFSFFQVKIFTGSVSVLLTSISLKIKKYFSLLKMSNAGEFPGVDFLGTALVGSF